MVVVVVVGVVVAVVVFVCVRAWAREGERGESVRALIEDIAHCMPRCGAEMC